MVLILVETRGQICPVVFLLFRTLSTGLENNDTSKCWSKICSLTLTYVVKLENCQNNISMYRCFPIKRFLAAQSSSRSLIFGWLVGE